MNKWHSRYSISWAIIFTSLLTISACDSGKPVEIEEPALRPVRTLLVQQVETGPFQEFTAVVDASQKVDLAFKISGKILEMPVKPGDKVKQGQLIAKLDDADINVQLVETKSSYDKALSDFNRAKDLIVSKSISQADFDQLQAQFNSAKAQLQTAQNKLDYTRLNASFDGIIAQRYAENFQEVTAQAPIVALHDLQNINFKVDIPESMLINVKPDSEPPKVSANFESIPDKTFDLTFKEISTQADEVTKTYQVVFTMPNSDSYTILPGMSARVRVMRPVSDQVAANYYVPEHAVLKDTQGNYVFTVESTEQGKGKIRRQQVIIGNITTWGIEIYSGIESEQHLVTAGMSKVSDGMIVKFDR